MEELLHQRSARIVLPGGVMQQACARAIQEWGPAAVVDVKNGFTEVRYFLGGRMHGGDRRSAAGGFRIRWGVPIQAQATIERLMWNPRLGGNEDEVRRVLDALIGWPATRSDSRSEARVGAV